MIALDTKRDLLRYIAETDRALPQEQQTVFNLRPLTVFEDAMVQDLTSYTGDGRMLLNTQQKAVLAFRLGVDSVQGLQDGAGKPVPLEREATQWGLVVSEAFMARLPRAVIMEVGAQVRALGLTEAEVKN